MRKKISFAFLFLTISFRLYSQAYKMGCIVDDKLKSVQTLPAFKGLGDSGPPDSYSLRKYCPTPGNQGNIGSCTAWTLGYGVMSIKYAIDHNITNKTDIDDATFSSMFIFNSIKITSCYPNSRDVCGGCGSSFTDGIDFLNIYGNVKHNEFDDYSCNGTIARSVAMAGVKNKIVGASTLFFDRTYISQEDKISKIIEQLYYNNPVFTSLTLPMINSEDSYFGLDQYFYKGIWTPPTYARPTPGASHALTIVGYDRVNQYFEILNSWGTRWGDQGFCKISFHDYLKYASYAGVVFTPPPVMDNYSNLKLQLAKYKRVGGIVHEDGEVAAKFNGSYYEATADKGQLFKINLAQLPGNYYIYVMSCDEKNNYNIHFPSKNESPYIYKGNLGYKIPQSSVLAFNQEADNLIILLSKNQIPDFENKFNHAVQYRNRLYEHLIDEFNADVDGANYNFDKSNISIKVPNDAQKPLLLFVNIKRTKS
ncbi:C1 family peptidase [Mucilaginibacter sp. UYCu711]|uniref:C1 family peptidase n=1 Tax=Mucilaginibacter sp. UYCu711 TaxID=3156339 RepID=UPI003D1BDDA2